MSELVKETQKFRLAHTMKAETRKLEPEEILWKVHQKLRNMAEEELLLKASERADVKEEAKETKREEIYQKLKSTLESIEQDLQEIIAQIPYLEFTDRVLQLTEETLELLQEGKGRPGEEIQKDIWKVNGEVENLLRTHLWIWRYPYQWEMLYIIPVSWPTKMTLESLFLQLSEQIGLKELFVKVENKLSLLECEPHHFMDIVGVCQVLLHHVSYILMVTTIDSCSIMMCLYCVYVSIYGRNIRE